ncbi:MAG: hypothetical protein M0Q41_13020 [Bacteroidales bacterium]|nr:hypothetical protein [Bacteroidales bacterium]
MENISVAISVILFQYSFRFPLFFSMINSSKILTDLMANEEKKPEVFTFFHDRTYFALSDKLVCFAKRLYSAQRHLIVRSISIKAKLALLTLSDPFSGNTDEFDSKSLYS